MSIFSQDTNSFSYFISQNEELSNSIYNSIVEIFQSNLLTLALELENRVIKYFIHKNNILVFDSIEDNVHVYLTTAPIELNHDDILKNINIESIKKDNSRQLYFKLLFKMNSFFIRSKKLEKNMNEAVNLLIEKGALTLEDKADYLKPYETKSADKFELGDNLSDFFTLITFLNVYARLNFEFNSSFIENISSFFNEIHKEKITGFYSDLSNILKICQAKDFRDYTNAFKHNDSDSLVWITPYNNIVISEQNVVFLCQFLNNQTINVYYIQPDSNDDCIDYQQNFKESLSYEDYIILMLESDIQNNQVNNLKNLAFSLTNKEFSFINPLIFNWFNTYLPYSLYELSKYAISSNKYL